MSLKAKLEAVIYAAEEPVTLAQLALLFTADALEWKAEQDAAEAAPGEPLVEYREFEYPEAGEAVLAQDAPAETGEVPQTEEATETGATGTAEGAAEPAGGTTAETAAEADTGKPGPAPAEGEDAPLDQPADTSPEPVSEAEGDAASTDEAKAEANLRREARLRDREVRNILRQMLEELIAEYASNNRGVEIREIAGGYRMATKPECHDAVRAFVKSLKPALKLSLPALETLAVIAYKQPVTAPEVNEIRGVDSSGVFGSLLARKLIATAGRKPVIGRPILYKTTKEFLLRFGLKDVTELPSMEEFEKMAASELDEPELPLQAEASPEIREDASLEEDAAKREEIEDKTIESPASESPAVESESTTPEAAPAAAPPTE